MVWTKSSKKTELEINEEEFPIRQSTDSAHHGYSRVFTDEGRQWKTGQIKRFPLPSTFALVGVVGICAGLVCIIHFSQGQDYDTWCVYSWEAPGLRKTGSKNDFLIQPERITVSITVNIWISFLMFIASKLLAFAFLESLTVNWWVKALKGESLKRLHLNYEVGRSASVVLRNLSWFNWLFLCSVVYTLFGVAGPLLQQSSTIRTAAGTFVNLTRHDYPQPHNTTFQAPFPTRFPSVLGSSTLNPSFFAERIWYRQTRDDDALVNITNCRPTGNNRPYSRCVGVFPSIGFSISCQRIEALVNPATDTPSNKLLEVSLNHNNSFWDLDIDMYWRQDIGSFDPASPFKVISKRCTLRPALVRMPVGFEMANDHSTEWSQLLRSYARSNPVPTDTGVTVDDDVVIHFQNWTSPVTGADPDVSDFTKRGYTLANAALMDDYDALPPAWQNGYLPSGYVNEGLGNIFPVVRLLEKPNDAPSVMGSLYEIFNRSVSAIVESTSISTPPIIMAGSTGIPYLVGHNGDFFSDPTQHVWNAIQRLIFRYSIHAAHSTIVLENDPSSIAWVSSAGMDDKVFPDQYSSTRTVYRNDYSLLASGIALMLVAVACTSSLFWGWWNLGRNVSLSPLEISRAMQIRDDAGNPLALGGATNATIDELVDLLGHIEVKYGEVLPRVLGMGMKDDVLAPGNGQKYL